MSISKNIFLSFITAVFATILMLFPCTACARDCVATEADNGKQYNLDIGDTLCIALEGNPTTGYSWKIASEASGSLLYVGQSYQSTSDLIGAGGTFTFTFQGAAKGTSTLRLIYVRPWEKFSEPTKTFEILVSVETDEQ